MFSIDMQVILYLCQSSVRALQYCFKTVIPQSMDNIVNYIIIHATIRI